MRDGDSGPKIPIAGAAGAAIHVALQRMATYCGEVSIIISKERVAGGGYTYSIANQQMPARPVPTK